MYILNNMGPSTDPWGTSCSNCYSELKVVLIFIRCQRSLKQLKIVFKELCLSHMHLISQSLFRGLLYQMPLKDPLKFLRRILFCLKTPSISQLGELKHFVDYNLSYIHISKGIDTNQYVRVVVFVIFFQRPLK